MVGMSIAAASLENNMEVPLKKKNNEKQSYQRVYDPAGLWSSGLPRWL